MDPRQLFMLALTLMTWSYLYRENFFYRLAEKTFIGITVGQLLCLQLQALWSQDIALVTRGEWLLILPTVIGATYLLRLSQKYRWISRYAVALLVASSVGLAVRVLPWIVEQHIVAVMAKLTVLDNAIILTAVVTSIFYFYFMRKPGGIAEQISKIGRGFIMVNLGAIAAGVFLVRLATLTERVQFILRTLGIIP